MKDNICRNCEYYQINSGKKIEHVCMNKKSNKHGQPVRWNETCKAFKEVK